MPKIKIFKKPQKTATSSIEYYPEGGSFETTTERKNKRNYSTSSVETKPDGVTVEKFEKRKGRNIEKGSTVTGPETASSWTAKEKAPRKPLLGFLGLAKKKKEEND